MRPNSAAFFLSASILFFGAAQVAYGQSAPPPEPTTVRFPSEKPFVELPFETERNWVVIPVSVNDSKPMRFVLDTGAPVAMLHNSTLAGPLKLNIVGQARVRGAGSGPDLVASVADSITYNIAGVEFPNRRLVIEPPPGPGGVSRMPAIRDGVIGRQVFESAVVEFDWEKKVIRLYDPAKYSYSGKGSVLPLTFDSRKAPYVNATAVVSGDRAIQLKMIIDTGAGSAISLEPGVKPPDNAIATIIGRGISGVVRGQVGRVKSFKLGGYELKDILASFPDAPISRAGASEREGLIGSDLLRRFKVIFDYSRSQMIVEPNRHFGEPFEFSMSGIAFVPRGADAKRLTIADVINNSPAKEAGLQAGDEILAIDGRPSSEFTDDDLYNLFRQGGGREIKLAIQREGKQLEAKIKLRRLV